MNATEQIKNLELKIKELETENSQLHEMVDFMPRKLYGTKSEKTSSLGIKGQMSLFDELETLATIPAEAIQRINQLFEIEKRLEVLTPEKRKEERRILETEILDGFWTWAESVQIKRSYSSWQQAEKDR